MPLYDYVCDSCGRVFEARHGMNDKPELACPSCGRASTHKIPSLCSIVIGSPARRKWNDRFRREGAMRAELKERYGVEKVVPLKGMSLADVYADVRSRGSYVRDEMDRSIHENRAKRAAKQKEWKQKAVRRATPRRMEMERRKAAEDAAKRAIRL